MSSNLHQLGAVVDLSVTLSDEIDGVLQKFRIVEGKPLVIDIVAHKGRAWIKVVCRCPNNIHYSFITGGREGERSIVEQAELLVQYAGQHQVFFSTPKVFILFCKGISESVATALQVVGCQVLSDIIIPDDELRASAFAVGGETDEEEECMEEAINEYNRHYTSRDKSESSAFVNSRAKYSQTDLDNFASQIRNTILGNISISKPISTAPSMDSTSGMDLKEMSQTDEDCLVNRGTVVSLDVTAMVAYISNTSNGHAHFLFQDKFLAEQAENERSNSVKEVIEKYWKDCEVLVCQEAFERFSKIVQDLAGENEKKRAQTLLKSVKIVPTEDVLEDKIKLTGRLNASSRKIFGSSYHYKAPIITANNKFLRGAVSQGFKLAALPHNPRALTEKKEVTAQPLPKDGAIC